MACILPTKAEMACNRESRSGILNELSDASNKYVCQAMIITFGAWHHQIEGISIVVSMKSHAAGMARKHRALVVA